MKELTGIHCSLEKSQEKLKNDYALMSTKYSIPFSDLVKPIVLPAEDLSETGLDALVSGWGRISASAYIISITSHSI